GGEGWVRWEDFVREGARLDGRQGIEPGADRRRERGRARCPPPSSIYLKSERTACELWLACDSAAMPLWVRMLNFVMLADSSAMFASRSRLSAAWVLTDCDCASPMANWSRFSSAPTLPCAVPSAPTAE